MNKMKAFLFTLAFFWKKPLYVLCMLQILGSSLSKKEQYELMQEQIQELLTNETDLLANLANFTALLYHSLPDINWLGFYFLQENQLVLGPFQGKPACTRIALGKGVCGSAAKQKKTIIVDNVHAFPGHITCDPDSASEMVIPILLSTSLVGVLDIDSPILQRFDEIDQLGLEKALCFLLPHFQNKNFTFFSHPQNQDKDMTK